jgi:hypothetical protein
MADKPAKSDPSSFLNKVLDATPKWAMGMLGTVFGFTVCFIAIVNLADLKPISLRLANAYADRIERATGTLEDVVSRLVAQQSSIEKLDARMTESEMEMREIKKRVTTLEVLRK